MSDRLDELLDAASESLRDETATGSERGKATQWAVIDGLRTRRRRKDWALASSVAFCILFVAPTVWAHVTGRLDALIAVVTSPPPVMASNQDTAERAPRVAPNQPIETLSEQPAPNNQVPDDETLEPVDDDITDETAVEVLVDADNTDEILAEAPPSGESESDAWITENAPRRNAVVAEPPRPRRTSRRPRPREDEAEVVDVRERELFARAHRSHFDGGMPSQALARWNEYLAAYPAGRYVPEARYNRALAWVRLGDYVRARQVLERFARGEFGPGRRAQAAELLELIATDDANEAEREGEPEGR